MRYYIVRYYYRSNNNIWICYNHHVIKNIMITDSEHEITDNKNNTGVEKKIMMSFSEWDGERWIDRAMTKSYTIYVFSVLGETPTTTESEVTFEPWDDLVMNVPMESEHYRDFKKEIGISEMYNQVDDYRIRFNDERVMNVLENV